MTLKFMTLETPPAHNNDSVLFQSLSGIDDRVTSMKVQVQQLDEEIRGMVRGQADSGHDGGVALEEAHVAIQELFG